MRTLITSLAAQPSFGPTVFYTQVQISQTETNKLPSFFFLQQKKGVVSLLNGSSFFTDFKIIKNHDDHIFRFLAGSAVHCLAATGGAPEELDSISTLATDFLRVCGQILFHLFASVSHFYHRRYCEGKFTDAGKRWMRCYWGTWRPPLKSWSYSTLKNNKTSLYGTAQCEPCVS